MRKVSLAGYVLVHMRRYEKVIRWDVVNWTSFANHECEHIPLAGLTLKLGFVDGRFERDHDDYSIIMAKALADRLAEVGES